MQLEKLEISQQNIAMVGDFNPAIFHPSFLLAHNLISPTEAENADIQLVHKDVALFKIEWLGFEVTRDRFKIYSTSEAYSENLRDITTGIFSILKHTPIKAIGFNSEFHIRATSEEGLAALFEELAPKRYWQSILETPDLNTIAMRQTRQGKYPGYTTVFVQPSALVIPGVYFLFSDHFEKPETKDATYYVDIINDQWQEKLIAYKKMAEKFGEK